MKDIIVIILGGSALIVIILSLIGFIISFLQDEFKIKIINKKKLMLYLRLTVLIIGAIAILLALYGVIRSYGLL